LTRPKNLSSDAGMPKPRLPYVQRETSRHGKVIFYFRRGDGPRIRLRGDYGSAEFIASYNLALAGEVPKTGAALSSLSIAWLVSRYRESSAWRNLAPGTHTQREGILRSLPQDVAFKAITRKAIVAGMDRRSHSPDAANVFLYTLRHLFEWAVYAEHARIDPTLGVKKINRKSEGFHVWTDEEIERFEARWLLGTRERLALDLLLYTGVRRSDAVRIGRPHVRDGVLRFRTSKGNIEVGIPILPPLARSVEATRTGDLTFICTARGLPMGANVFTVWFRNAAKAAGCPGSAHGLRKASATRMAQAGGTTGQLKASYGWKTNAMAEHYTQTAERALMAADGMAKLERKK
jgi:site-specific recombinase XerD